MYAARTIGAIAGCRAMLCWPLSEGVSREREPSSRRSEEVRVNKGLSIGLIVLGVLLLAFAPLEHYVVRIKMDHLASAILGLGVALVVLGAGLLLLRRRAVA